jgi:hypothetical protein
MYLTGEFQQAQSAAAAIHELRADGFCTEDLVVFCDEPVEFRRGVLDRPSRMSLASVLGGIAFLSLVIGFVYFTQHNYPLVTGGMPIFSFWSTGVIFYEMTMLGAILATFVWFVWESRLLRRRPREPVPVPEPGWICLRVRCNAEQAVRVAHCLNRAGSAQVRELGDPA